MSSSALRNDIGNSKFFAERHVKELGDAKDHLFFLFGRQRVVQTLNVSLALRVIVFVFVIGPSVQQHVPFLGRLLLNRVSAHDSIVDPRRLDAPIHRRVRGSRFELLTFRKIGRANGFILRREHLLLDDGRFKRLGRPLARLAGLQRSATVSFLGSLRLGHLSSLARGLGLVQVFLRRRTLAR